MTPEKFSRPPESVAPPSASELIARHAVPLPLAFIDEINAELRALKAQLPEESLAPLSCDTEDPSPPLPVLIEDFQSFDVNSGAFLSPCGAETPQPEMSSLDTSAQKRRDDAPIETRPAQGSASTSGDNAFDGADHDISMGQGVRSSVSELTKHLNGTRQQRDRALMMALGDRTARPAPEPSPFTVGVLSEREEIRQSVSRAHRQTAEGLPALAHIKSP